MVGLERVQWAGTMLRVSYNPVRGQSLERYWDYKLNAEEFSINQIKPTYHH